MRRSRLIHTKIDHPKEFASYVHTYKNVAPGYFVAVAEELNFSRAARRLRIAQPAVSHHKK